ncbi:MAG TPA: DUF1569 domain-containing protein [Acidobacteriaceae bacterium]
MRNMFDIATAQEVGGRLASLTPESTRQWGTMSAAQTVAHCSLAIEMALGEKKPPRVLIGRILGPVVKKLALGNDAPMRKNSPTAPSLIVSDDRDLEAEKLRLAGLIDRFSKGGAAVCTDHPHAFFGTLTPEQWAELMYKHLDHHLRQFGA